MMLSNKIIIASAGAGKTTEIINLALAARPKKSAIVTFTLNNLDEIHKKFFEVNGCVPPEVTIYPWYTFMLHELVRPFQGAVYEKRIASVAMINGASARGVARSRIPEFYLNKAGDIYSDKLSDFALLCEARSNGRVLRRLADMFDCVFIDEVQDLAGFDIEMLESLLGSPIALTLVGDVRQATFRTNYSRKNKAFIGRGLLKKIDAWKRAGLCDVSFMAQSHRCVQGICDVADLIFPDLPKATSLNGKTTGHDGAFVVRSKDVAAYVQRYSPQILRLNKRFEREVAAMNFGASKGLGFTRVLIVPYGGITKWLSSGDCTHVQGSADEVYVAITRARQSVAFIHDGSCSLPGVAVYSPDT
jgi:DNA helicase-2/ATP-dependent DNA helicase PcrA